MADLTIFGQTFTNVSGIKATDTDGNEVVYGGGWTNDDVANRAYTGDIEITISSPKTYAFANSLIESITGNNVTSLGANHVFHDCAFLKSADFPNLNGNIGAYTFYNCTALERVNLPKAKTMTGYDFCNCSNIEEIMLPSIGNNSATGADTFRSCIKLKTCDIGECIRIDGNAFRDDAVLSAVILRRSTAICALSNVSAFVNTPFAAGATHSGHIYVPSTLISAYQTASNWATLYADYPDIFQPIEGSIYE